MPILRACATVFGDADFLEHPDGGAIARVRNAVLTVIAEPTECSSSGIHAPSSVWIGSSSRVTSDAGE